MDTNILPQPGRAQGVTGTLYYSLKKIPMGQPIVDEVIPNCVPSYDHMSITLITRACDGVPSASQIRQSVPIRNGHSQ
jgi:hypothetical protein